MAFEGIKTVLTIASQTHPEKSNEYNSIIQRIDSALTQDDVDLILDAIDMVEEDAQDINDYGAVGDARQEVSNLPSVSPI